MRRCAGEASTTLFGHAKKCLEVGVEKFLYEARRAARENYEREGLKSSTVTLSARTREKSRIIECRRRFFLPFTRKEEQSFLATSPCIFP